MGERATRRAGESKESKIEPLIPKLGKIKENIKELQKEETPLISEIKSGMLGQKLDKLSTGGYTAKITVIQNQSLNEEEAIKILEEFADEKVLREVIYTQKHINHEALERAVFTRAIPESLLTTAIEVKEPTIRLEVPKDKKSKKEWK